MSGWTFLGIALAFFAATTVGWAFVRSTGDPTEVSV